MKIKIPSESTDSDRPYIHLQPIVDYLVDNGNVITTDKNGFYLTQGGWCCDLLLPIDFVAIENVFELPDSVLFSSRENSILCEKSWTQIRGNVR